MIYILPETEFLNNRDSKDTTLKEITMAKHPRPLRLTIKKRRASLRD